jgi:NADPH:quinone reductase-like Zn-dependent oxidoreductase
MNTSEYIFFSPLKSNIIKKGDRVFSVTSESGTYAEYAVCNKSGIFKLPDNLNFDEGIFLYYNFEN